MPDRSDTDAPRDVTPKEVRARAKSERHRVRSELHQLRGASGSLADDVDEPGPEFKTPRHHEPAKSRALQPKRERRHWKLPFWKRRSAVRRQRAKAALPADE
jgi:hypothetical protein